MKLYVSTKGHTDADGSCSNPFPCIEDARDAVRAMIRAGLTEPVTVVIDAGEYRTQGLVFDQNDSGTAGCPITYEADGEVILNGGMTLPADRFEPLNEGERTRLHGDAGEHVVRMDLTRFGLTREDWGEIAVLGKSSHGEKYDGFITSPMSCELFFNDTRMTVARYPNEGYLYTEKAISGIGWPNLWRTEEWRQMRNPPADRVQIDAETAERVRGWETQEEAWTFGYPWANWADVASPFHIDCDNRIMETRFCSDFGLRDVSPYYFFNVFEELDAAGEWYLDRAAGMLYLYPPSDLSDADICLSLLTKPILTNNGAEYLILRGITFQGTRDHALLLRANHQTIENCTVKNVAEWGITAEGDDITIRGCEIHHTGKGGISITGGDRATLTPSRNVIENNDIHHVGVLFATYNPAVLLRGVGSVCAHNRLHDMPHSAVLFCDCNNCILEYNEIHDCCLFSDDAGAVYAGADYSTYGNIIRYNYFHDLDSSARRESGMFAIYLDDNSAGFTIEHNLFVRCQQPLDLHGGHDIIFRWNLLLYACATTYRSITGARYGGAMTLKEGGAHLQKLSKLPWQGDVWRNAYPRIAEFLTWDPETEQIFPHYLDVSDNAIFCHAEVQFFFEVEKPEYHNHIENNRHFDACPTDDLQILCTEIAPEVMPNFDPIPFDQIGLFR